MFCRTLSLAEQKRVRELLSQSRELDGRQSELTTGKNAWRRTRALETDARRL